ncbi:Rho GTPase-activating protein 27 [Blastocladiella emersonii ATCC 22665]|nr:Rho GTPase-activating protein 27 [Blastocladiella emersonii ATCC 22665]
MSSARPIDQPTPAKPDDGWTTCVDEASGDSYYWNTVTGETTWDNPYSSSAAAKPEAPRLPGSAPTATDIDLDAIHPDRRAFFTGGAPPQSTSDFGGGGSGFSKANEAAAHLDHLLHTIDAVNNGTARASPAELLAMAGASGPRPTLRAVRGVLASRTAGGDVPAAAVAPPGVGDGVAPLDPEIAAIIASAPITSTSSRTGGGIMSHYFDEDAYQDEVNRRKAAEREAGPGQERRKVSKTQLANYRAKKEEHKKRKFMSKFANI